MRRVAITGIGVISPIGEGKSEFWDGLLEGRSGVGPIQSFDASGFASQIAAEVRHFVPCAYMPKRAARKMGRFSQLAVAAARLAQQDAGLEITQDGENVCIMLGVSNNGVQIMEAEMSNLLQKGTDRVRPFSAVKSYPGAPAANISVELGIHGESQTFTTGCSAGTNAIGYAFRNIRLGMADVVFAGGADAPISPCMMSALGNSRMLSQRNLDPDHASRPFDRQRDGWVLGEGAAILILEELTRASERNARIYAEIKGYACTSDGFDMMRLEESGRHASRAMVRALGESGLSVDDLDYVNANGSSSYAGDIRETRALKAVLGDRAYRIPVSSLKSMVGHPLAASGGLQTAACALAIHEGAVPPTINYEDPDKDCDLDYVPNQAREWPVEAAFTQSLGLGGNNACLVLEKA